MKVRATVPHQDRLSCDVVLRDGETVHVRTVGPEDETSVRAFLEHLTPESRHLRFFSAAADLAAAARWATAANPMRAGLIAETGDGTLVGHGVYVRADDSHAEVAFETAEDHRQRGMATALLERLVESARAAGITTMNADVLTGNEDMLAVFRDRYPTRETVEGDVAHVTFSIDGRGERP